MSRDLPTVSIARPDQETEIMAMCRRLWEENGLFSYSEDKVRTCLHKCYARKDANETPVIVGVICNDKGEIEASTCLMVSDFYYTDDWHLGELWNFVDAPHRVSRNAEALVTFGMECADKMGLPFFTGIITNKQMAGKVRLYRRLLGPTAGAFFIYNAPRWKREPMDDRVDLRARLKDAALKCTNFEVSNHVAQKSIAPLLREAAEALGEEDNLWGGSVKARVAA